MNSASIAAPRWAVSTRTRGEVRMAGASTPAMELLILGVPPSTTQAEVGDWLRDLAGVAVETSRTDARTLAIPALLYHALAGLLFSQSELWGAGASSAPCALAFVETPEGAAFGWVGDARVHVIADGRPLEPAWVIVRDEDGREARGVLLSGVANAQVIVEYGPPGERAGEAPGWVEAEWFVERRGGPGELEARSAEAPAESVARDTEGPVPVEVEPIEVASPASSAAGAGIELAPDAADGAWDALSAEQTEALTSLTAPREPHPVARWLGRVFGFARRQGAEPPIAPAPAEAGTPVSAYDALLSERVPETLGIEDTVEQTALELPESPPEPPSPPRAPEEPTVLPPAAPTVADAIARIESMARALEIEAAPGPARAMESAPPGALPGDEHSPPAPAMESARDRLLRAMESADAGGLPVLHVPLPEPPPERPLQIEREPVGADDTFRMPKLPSWIARGIPKPAAEAEPPSASGIPSLSAHGGVPIAPSAAPPAAPMQPATDSRVFGAAPPAAPVAAPPSLPPPPIAHAPPAAPIAAPPSVPAPSGPPRLLVSGVGATVSGPPVLRVSLADAAQQGPPVLKVEPTGAAPRVIVPTPPIAPVAAAPRAFAPPAAPQQRPRTEWPSLDELGRGRFRPSRRAWVIIAIVVGVFGAGWLVGVLANPAREGPSPFARVLAAVGLAPPRFTAVVNSAPGGAWIAVDGKDVAKRTPAQIELAPGPHRLTLTLPELGSADVEIRGTRGERVPVNPSLNGGLEVLSTDASVPISVALDGRPLGYAPLSLDDVAPGLHELQFSGPGMPAWAQTIQVGVRRVEQVIARPMSAPANGVLQVQATLNDEQGVTPLSGAQVFVDGELRGTTPASIELPRGPHSLKVLYRDETAPVQVIDLPGGNRRFASFAFGLDSPSPQVVLLGGVHPASAQQTAVVSAGLRGLQLADIREAWLHVRTAEGLWRRVTMTAMRGATGPVVVCVFPPTAFGAKGSAPWYVSVHTVQGDEYFSEMQKATLGPAERARPAAAATSKDADNTP